jgi:hypothetical protein
VIAGALFAAHAGVVTGLFGAADAAHAALGVDTALKHEALRHYCAGGYRACDFGITSAKQTGLLFAKSRFNGVTSDLPYYYRLVTATRVPALDYADAYPWLRRPFRYVPVPVARGLSSAMVRYLN